MQMPHVKPSFDCYIVAELDPKTLKIEAVRCYSSAPWLLTRPFGGPDYKAMLIVYQSLDRDSYETAKRICLAAYPRVARELAALFPLSDDEAPCNPPGACASHGRCWTHSVWDDPHEAL